MSLYLKRAITLSALVFSISVSGDALARVYVYEVTTSQARFQTASKMPPDAFLIYNGGYDIIYDLKVVATYPDKDMDKALKDFKLEKNNSNILLFTPIPNRIPRRPYYWWR